LDESVTNHFKEVHNLPDEMQRVFIVDSLVDHIVSDTAWKEISVFEKGRDIVDSILKSILESESIPERDSLINLAHIKSWTYNKAETLDKDSRISNAFKDEDSRRREHLKVVYTYKDAVVIRIPRLPKSNLGQIDNLGKVLRWIVTTLGYTKDQLKISEDPTLGDAFALPARLERSLDSMTLALSGKTTSLERVEFTKTGFKANLVEMVAAIYMLRLNSHLLRKSKQSETITLDRLRNAFNDRAGLNESSVTSYLASLVKETLTELTKSAARMPGTFIHSVKQANDVKSNLGVIAKMGWTTKVVNPTKTIKVLLTKVLEESAGDLNPEPKITAKAKKPKAKATGVIPVTDENTPSGIKGKEFRLGLITLMPLIDPNSQKSVRDQIGTDLLSVRNKIVLDHFNTCIEACDAINLAYATRIALDKKSKATPQGFKSVKGKAVRLSAGKPIMDSLGQKYPNFSAVPKNIREQLCKLLHRKLTGRPADEEEEDASASEASDNEE
jgi:hypothetical protein